APVARRDAAATATTTGRTSRLGGPGGEALGVSPHTPRASALSRLERPRTLSPNPEPGWPSIDERSPGTSSVHRQGLRKNFAGAHPPSGLSGAKGRELGQHQSPSGSLRRRGKRPPSPVLPTLALGCRQRAWSGQRAQQGHSGFSSVAQSRDAGNRTPAPAPRDTPGAGAGARAAAKFRTPSTSLVPGPRGRARRCGRRCPSEVTLTVGSHRTARASRLTSGH
ncbi:hypothetical protein MC885_004275, partial [Smutsia gigantea]